MPRIKFREGSSRSTGYFYCPKCKREWSAMLSEPEVPEECPDCKSTKGNIMKKVTPQAYNIGKNPYVFKCLDISMGHITKKDAELLIIDDSHPVAHEKYHNNPVVSYEFEYGFFVFVPENDEGYSKDALKFGYSKAFVEVMDKARKLKCKFIQFDGDGIEYDDLPTFKW